MSAPRFWFAHRNMRIVKHLQDVCQTSCYSYLPNALPIASTDVPALFAALRNWSSVTPNSLVQ